MFHALDRVIGRVTMYRLVTLALAITAAGAMLLSLVGALFFTPIELLASAGVAVASTVLASRVLALLLRVRPHLESSIVTGLILFFLFWPSLAAADLGALALAGVLATASKYLLAWRGRHIFNPAAAGAALVAMLQLGGTGWWVATGALLPFTAIGGFLVLHRTRRLPMATVFIAVTATILIVRLGTSGQGLLDSIATTFASYPIVFFAAFMLSEPLTLPPRRWQQLALAALVGVLFTIPFQLGAISLSFEAALLVGNLLAFLVGQRRGIRMAFLGRRQLTPTSWEFRFEPRRRVRFSPGQYVELALPHGRADARGSRRMFSIASAPAEHPEVAVAMRMPQRTSSFKTAMLALEPGAQVHATSVGGDFLLPADPAKPVLLIAGGIGITPFLSQLAHDRASGIDRDSVVVYAVSSLEELAFRDELDLERVRLVSPAPPVELPASWRWIGEGPITPELLRDEVPDAGSRRAYVSGAPSFVGDIRIALRRAGVRRVETDYFSGY